MKTTLKDEEVIRLYRDTQPNDCFEALYSRYVNKVYRRCLSFTHDSAKAEDFTHDIFLKVFAKLDKFQERSSFSTWLYSISHNYCMDQLRLSKRLQTVNMEDETNYDLIDSDDTAATEEMHYQLKQVMNAISADEITMLRLKYEDELSIEDIAQQYNLKASAVKMRLKRSRDKLYRLYEQHYAD